MGYRAFCRAVGLNPIASDSFVRFALVGGVPKYWEAVRRGQSAVALAEALFFGTAPALEFEPARLLKDENIVGASALAVLEAVGRGAHKPSEIAGRLGVPQTALSRALQTLLDAHLLTRELPFGESVRTTKRSLYRLLDPTLRFWFHVYSPHRSRWRTYTGSDKRKLLEDHASTVFEDRLRAARPGAARYWEGAAELDVVSEEEGGGALLVAEVKWAALARGAKAALATDLESRFRRTQLGQRWPKARFEVLDHSAIKTLE